MKLILQIAAGVVLGWLITKGIEVLTVAGVAHSVAKSLPRPPQEVYPQPRATPRESPPAVIPQPEPPAAPADNRQWSIQTPGGKTYSGTGQPPDGGLAQAKARDDHS